MARRSPRAPTGPDPLPLWSTALAIGVATGDAVTLFRLGIRWLLACSYARG
jgi:hypothetical protein